VAARATPWCGTVNASADRCGIALITLSELSFSLALPTVWRVWRARGPDSARLVVWRLMLYSGPAVRRPFTAFLSSWLGDSDGQKPLDSVSDAALVLRSQSTLGPHIYMYRTSKSLRADALAGGQLRHARAFHIPHDTYNTRHTTHIPVATMRDPGARQREPERSSLQRRA